jgi:hypothetical protein
MVKWYIWGVFILTLAIAIFFIIAPIIELEYHITILTDSIHNIIVYILFFCIGFSIRGILDMKQ